MSTRRDYKPKTRRQTPAPSGRLGSQIIIVALLITLFVGFLMYIRQSNPGTDPGATPGTQINPGGAPKYAFYTDLPQRDSLLENFRPQRATATPTARTGVPATEVLTTGVPATGMPATGMPAPVADARFTVQAGAFRNPAEADRVRARLALLGIKAQVEPGEVNDTPIHRVRIGPFADAQQAGQLRRRLSEHNIPSITIKLQ